MRETCRCCGKNVEVMCQQMTGFCSQRCEEGKCDCASE